MSIRQSVRNWASSLKGQLLALWFCRRHPDMPLAAKLIATLVVAYAFSPVDLIPDFIPVIGFLDDVILVPLGIAIAIRMIPDHVLADSRRQAEAWVEEARGRPRSYVAAMIVVAIWIALCTWALLAAWPALSRLL